MKYLKSMTWVAGLLATQLGLAITIVNENNVPAQFCDGNDCTSSPGDTVTRVNVLGQNFNIPPSTCKIIIDNTGATPVSCEKASTVAGSGGTSSAPTEPDFRK